MQEKYRGLAVCSKVLLVAAVLMGVIGTVVGLASLISSGSGAAIFGILSSLLYGVLLYSFSEVIKLLLDMKGEVPDKNLKKE
jgi:membrane associated rhomboid family serine protease